jgi:hypothetical protein
MTQKAIKPRSRTLCTHRSVFGPCAATLSLPGKGHRMTQKALEPRSRTLCTHRSVFGPCAPISSGLRLRCAGWL